MTKKILPLILPVVLLSACVTTKTYQAKEAEAQSQKSRGDSLDKKVADLSKAKQDVETKLKSSDDQIAAIQTTNTGLQMTITGLQASVKDLQTSNKDLQQSLEAKKTQLTQKVSDLIKERDELSKKLTAQETQSADLTNKLADLNKKLADAETAKKTLEDADAAEIAKVKKSYEDLTSGLKSEISAGQVQITELKGKLTVNMVDKILFDSGEAVVKGDGQKVLEKVGGLLNQVQDKDIRIEGHTDNKPITVALQDKYPTNWELSTARATAVARYLIDHAKVDPKRIVATGYGEYRPKTDNSTPEARAENRRIEIVLVPRE
jgi:chemotaxis protein MotB